MLTDETIERTPYCVSKGCAGLPPREHLEAHTRDGSTGPDQVAELIDAFERHVRAQDAAEPIIARWAKGVVHHPAGTTVECVDADDPLRGISLELTIDDREALGLMLVDPEGEMDQADATTSKKAAVPLCYCGHRKAEHQDDTGLGGAQCRTCPGDSERSWRHPYTPEEN